MSGLKWKEAEGETEVPENGIDADGVEGTYVDLKATMDEGKSKITEVKVA